MLLTSQIYISSSHLPHDFQASLSNCLFNFYLNVLGGFSNFACEKLNTLIFLKICFSIYHLVAQLKTLELDIWTAHPKERIRGEGTQDPGNTRSTLICMLHLSKMVEPVYLLWRMAAWGRHRSCSYAVLPVFHSNGIVAARQLPTRNTISQPHILHLQLSVAIWPVFIN